MGIQLFKAEARLEFIADTLEVLPPAILLDDDGGPSNQLLRFCREHCVSLDWVFCGDLRPMIRRAATCCNR